MTTISAARLRDISKVIASLLMIILGIALINIRIEDELLDFLAFAIALGALNLALAIPARILIRGTAAMGGAVRLCTATALLGAFLLALYWDFGIMSQTIKDYTGLNLGSLARLLTMAIWVAGFEFAWRPFIARAENRYIFATVTLVMALTTVTLFFADAFGRELFDVSSENVKLAQFMLMSTSVASALSSFLIQRASHASLVQNRGNSSL